MSFLCLVFLLLALPLYSLGLPTLVGLLPLIALYYVATRLSLVFPASAVGRRMDWSDSWQVTRSNSARLSLLLLPAIFIPFYLFVRLPTLADALGLAELVPRGSIAYEGSLSLMMLLMWSAGMLLLSQAYSWFVSRPSE